MTMEQKSIDEAKEEIRALLKRWESNEALRTLGSGWLYEQIVQIVDKMYAALSDSVRTLIIESGGDPDGGSYDRVFASLEKAERKLIDSIGKAFQTLAEDGGVEKAVGGILLALLTAAILAIVLSGCDEAKDKAEAAAENAKAIADIESKKDELLAGGAGMYEIISSGNENICELCAEMNGQVFPLDELDIGVNAPPFHPNCGCGIREYVGEEVEEEPISVNDWLNAYLTPSAAEGRDVHIPSNRTNYWASYEGTLGINLIKDKGLTVIEREDGAVVDENGRYWICVGPIVLNPDYPDNGRIWSGYDGLLDGTEIDILVRDNSTGELSYIYAVVGDYRAHTYNPGEQGHGIVHNGVPYPNSWNARNEMNPRTGTNVFPGDNTSVEFIRTVPDERQRAFSSQYELVKLVVY